MSKRICPFMGVDNDFSYVVCADGNGKYEDYSPCVFYVNNSCLLVKSAKALITIADVLSKDWKVKNGN